MAAVTSACIVLAAACGGSGASKGASGSNDTTTTKADPAADRMRARSLLIAAADVPAGWRRSGDVANDDRRDEQELADCTGALDPKHNVVNIDGDTFADFDDQAASSVHVVDTHAHFMADARAIESGKFLMCFRTLLSEGLPASIAEGEPDATVHDLKVVSLPSATYGEVTVGFRASFTITASGASTTLYIDQFELGAGRDEVSVNFDSQDALIDPTLEQSVLGKVGVRLGKARS
jgi:hypothetical protein